jgi:hypothetical protein
MGLLSTLQALGTRLKLIEHSSEEAKSAKKIATRSVTLKELMVEVDRNTVAALAQGLSQVCVPLEKVFESAGIKPHPKGWNIDRLLQVLGTDAYRAMDRKAIQKAILAQLAAEGVSVDELMKDAISRDQALDTFEASAKVKARDVSSARGTKISQLESQRDKIAAEVARLKAEDNADGRRLVEWHSMKSEYEKQLSWAVGFLTECSSPETPNKSDQKKLV